LREDAAVRLLFLMELLVATAVGFGLARWHGQNLWPSVNELTTWFGAVPASFLAGFGLVVGVGTWVEAARRRWQVGWGPGRWVWSVVALNFVFQNVLLALESIDLVFDGRNRETIMLRFRDRHAIYFAATVPVFVAALLVTCRGARPATGAAPDARERAGRAYAGLLIAFVLIEETLRLLGGLHRPPFL
jgi:hypothetical protein